MVEDVKLRKQQENYMLTVLLGLIGVGFITTLLILSKLKAPFPNPANFGQLPGVVISSPKQTQITHGGPSSAPSPSSNIQIGKSITNTTKHNSSLGSASSVASSDEPSIPSRQPTVAPTQIPVPTQTPTLPIPIIPTPSVGISISLGLKVPLPILTPSVGISLGQ